MVDLKDCEVYNADGMVLGRFASMVAKRLILGRSIAVINAERAIISGDKNVIAARYRVRLTLQEKENPEHSPYWPRRPDMLVRRIIRGMLPYSKATGRAAYKRLVVFRGSPEELKNAKHVELNMKNPKSIYAGYITVRELASELGYDR